MVFNSYISSINNTNKYVEFKKNESPSNKIDAFINKMIENYNFKHFYLTRYNSDYLESIESISSDLKEYIDFLDSDKVIDNTNYKYIFISETNDGRFSYLRIA